MRNVLNPINMLGFRFLITTTNIRKINKIIRMLVAIKYNSTQITKLTLSLSSPRNLVVTVRLGERGEKCTKIKEIKKGMGKLTYVT